MFEEMAHKRRLAGASEGGKRKGVEKSFPPPKHRARDDAAKVFKVNDKWIQQAKALLAEAPDLAGQVEACTTSLASAGGMVKMCILRHLVESRATTRQGSGESPARPRRRFG
jgi:hypothetical protein